MTEIKLRHANNNDRPILDRLWLMFGHDLSEFRDMLPNPDGSFRNDRLVAAVEDPSWRRTWVMRDDLPVGLAIVRGLTSSTRVLSGFFIARGARRAGVGLSAVRPALNRHPGRWEIAFQDDNIGAVRFWRRVAASVAPCHLARRCRLKSGSQCRCRARGVEEERR